MDSDATAVEGFSVKELRQFSKASGVPYTFMLTKSRCTPLAKSSSARAGTTAADYPSQVITMLQIQSENPRHSEAEEHADNSLGRLPLGKRKAGPREPLQEIRCIKGGSNSHGSGQGEAFRRGNDRRRSRAVWLPQHRPSCATRSSSTDVTDAAAAAGSGLRTAEPGRARLLGRLDQKLEVDNDDMSTTRLALDVAALISDVGLHAVYAAEVIPATLGSSAAAQHTKWISSDCSELWAV
ncbi:hypothetical protein LZ30DRAFT_772719 [Colletotrichum cereale]|nr:hypothetical protein LZ30DRAFT_772719 [Colletotrichum cereale]